MKYFFDTNILSYLFKKQSNFINKFIELCKQDDADFCISRVTYYELKRGFLAIGATALENDAILVTNNAKHLGRIDGLKVEI